MTKREMMTVVAQKAGITIKEAERTITLYLNTIVDELQGEGKVLISGLGTFEVRQRRERTGRNPRTGTPTAIPACKVVAFKPGKQLKEQLDP